MALSTISGGSVETMEKVRKDNRVRISRQLMFAAFICLLAWILLIIAFSSPYWLSSYAYTYSSFVRLGLWDFCFRDFRHPYFQHDEKFDGCHWIYSSKYHNIRDWLQPPWFIFVQIMMVLSLIFSLLSLIVIAVILMLFVVKLQFVAIGVTFVLEVLTAFPLFLAITVFGAMAYTRSWLLNPQFNHFDWSYYVAIASLLFHCIAALILCLEMFRSYHRRRKFNNLVYNMQPRSPMQFGHSYETRPMMAETQEQSVPLRQPIFTQV